MIMLTKNAPQGHTTFEKEEVIMKNLQSVAQVPMDHIIALRMNSITY
jgi:hypothetical protein